MSKQSSFGDTVYIKEVDHTLDDYENVATVYNGQKHVYFRDDTYKGCKYLCTKITILAIGSDGSWLLSNGCQTYMLNGVRTVSIFSSKNDGEDIKWGNTGLTLKKGENRYIHQPVITQEECLDYLEYRDGWNSWNQEDYVFDLDQTLSRLSNTDDWAIIAPAYDETGEYDEHYNS
jgi:hypothetical protein